MTSSPLLINSFIVISPALPKGLFSVNGFVGNFTSEIIISLLTRKNSLTFEIFELFKSVFSFIMSLTNSFFLNFSHIASPFKNIGSFDFFQSKYLE